MSDPSVEGSSDNAFFVPILLGVVVLTLLFGLSRALTNHSKSSCMEIELHRRSYRGDLKDHIKDAKAVCEAIYE
jgi:hypothetical protein